MIKNILTALLLSIVSLSCFSQGVGTWKAYSNFAPNYIQKVIDTKDLVYYLVSGCVFTYDKKTGETIGYNSGNGLSDINVIDMFRNYDRDYVMLFYNSGNIDLLYDNGDVVNMGDILAATSVSDKSLNDVAFSGNDAYVATGFGIVRFDTSRHIVVESGIYNHNISTIAVAGNRLVICANEKLYYSPLEEKHNSFDSFTCLGEVGKLKQMEALSEVNVLYTSDSDVEGIYTMDFDSNTLKKNYIYLYFNPKISRHGNELCIGNYSEYVLVDSLANCRRFTLPGSVKKKGYEGVIAYNSTETDGSLWFVNGDGLGHYDAVSGDITQNPVKPMGTFLNLGAWKMIAGSNPGEIYVSNCAESHVVAVYSKDDMMSLNRLENGFVTDITPGPDDVEIVNPNSNGKLCPAFSMVEDKEEPGVLYVGTWYEGIYKMRDGKQIDKYDWRNMPLNQTYNCTGLSLDIDSDNNLWVYAYDYNENIFIGVLPASKRKQNTVSKDDWVKIKTDDIGVFFTRDSKLKVLKHPKNRNLIVVTESDMPHKFLIYNTNGTVDTTADDTYHVYSSFTDQDNKPFGPLSMACVEEDLDGSLWIGTEDGVIAIHNPASMLAGNGIIDRVKVPRNDGTVYADYLLTNRIVSAITVDGANRKWFGTTSSGLYLVSADGKEIISNFTSENSGLPVNEITSVLCNPENNSVYVGTRYGLYEYISDAAPASDDYSDIYAYPNPVRPDYGGPITITGLMDDSLVKIADIAGNVFYQAKSTGGMAVWDGCDASGRRVKTGVYLVFVSSGGGDNGGSSKGAVTKIMIIN